MQIWLRSFEGCNAAMSTPSLQDYPVRTQNHAVDSYKKIQEYSTKAGDAGVTVRSCMTLTVLADVYLMAIFSDHRGRSITGHELLVCL